MSIDSLADGISSVEVEAARRLGTPFFVLPLRLIAIQLSLLCGAGRPFTLSRRRPCWALAACLPCKHRRRAESTDGDGHQEQQRGDFDFLRLGMGTYFSLSVRL
jgi:hypothetical protein